MKKYLTDFPELLTEWDYAKNTDIDINTVKFASAVKVWWKCAENHEWETAVVHRTCGKSNCGQCHFNNRTYNASVAKNCPEFMKEWDYELNIDMDPNKITKSAHKSVHWKCAKNHRYTKQVHIKQINDCPQCNLVEHKNCLINFPDLVELWHPTKNGELKPEQFTIGSNETVWWICKNNHETKCKICYMYTNKQKCLQCDKMSNNYMACTPEQLLINKYPEIANEWDYEKNKNINIANISSGSIKKVCWVCINNHKWEQIISTRTKSNSKCPQCARKEYLDINSVGLIYPLLVKDWSPKNKLSPFEVSYGYSKSDIYWKCDYGHTYKSMIHSKVKMNGCPYCSKYYATPEYNFGTKYPLCLKNWNYLKNTFLPFSLTPQTRKQVWMKCQRNHEWQIKISDLSKNSKCMQCNLEDNCLQIKFPEIASEWNYEKNGIDVTPLTVTFGSEFRAWWKCKKGHEWQAMVNMRTGRFTCCPICSNGSFSRIRIDVLEFIAEKENSYIQHAMNDGEHKITVGDKIIKVDGYCSDTNTIFDVNSCYYDGHISPYCTQKRNRQLLNEYPYDKSHINRYIETLKREYDLRNLGYNVRLLWGCECKIMLDNEK